MIWSTATTVISKLAKSGGSLGKLRQDDVLKSVFGLADTGIPIGRENEPAAYVRWKAGDNDAFSSGKVENEEGLRWREFIWSGPQSIEDCSWGPVRWRFYSNGLVCFDAQMANISHRLDTGDVQGHRIELREKNGLLLGVWIAGFFVRRSLPLRGFAGAYVDEHLPLKLHFDDIKDDNLGAWVCL
jgi:hypothetical protein